MKRYILLLCAFPLMIGMLSCQDLMEKIVKAPDPYIENIVEGHEQIYSIQAILRLALKFEDPSYEVSFEPYYYAAYELDDNKLYPFPVYQEIEIRKNDEGSMEIVSERESFDVIKSDKFYYALEIKYFDINNKLINHQFSSWYKTKDKKNKWGGFDDPNSTLLVHQHFFTLANYSLDKRFGVYPMTMDVKNPERDSLYIDKFTFDFDIDGKPVLSDFTSQSNIFIPKGKIPNNDIKYSYPLAYEAEVRKGTANSSEPFTFEGVTYLPYKGLDVSILNKRVPQLFSYEYRDTDPVEEYLGTELEDQDDLSRIRTGHVVGLLRFQRKIGDGSDMYKQDFLGFKGILSFKQAHTQFQMNVRCAHITTEDDTNKQNLRFPFGKYRRGDGPMSLMSMEPYGYNEIKPAWDSYDINFPLPFRVIADDSEGADKFVEDITSIEMYKNIPPAQLINMFLSNPYSYFAKRPHVYF